MAISTELLRNQSSQKIQQTEPPTLPFSFFQKRQNIFTISGIKVKNTNHNGRYSAWMNQIDQVFIDGGEYTWSDTWGYCLYIPSLEIFLLGAGSPNKSSLNLRFFESFE